MRPEFKTMPNPTAKSVQDETQRIFDASSELVIARRLRVSLTLAGGATKIAHGMRSVPADVMLGVPSVLAAVTQVQAPDAQFIYLQTTDDCEISVWLL